MGAYWWAGVPYPTTRIVQPPTIASGGIGITLYNLVPRNLFRTIPNIIGGIEIPPYNLVPRYLFRTIPNIIGGIEIPHYNHHP